MNYYLSIINIKFLGGNKMYEIKILYKDRSREVITCKSEDLTKTEDALIKLQGDTIKCFATYKIEGDNRILV